MKILFLCIISVVSINAMDNNSIVPSGRRTLARSISESDIQYPNHGKKQGLQLKNCDPIIARCREKTIKSRFHAYALLDSTEKIEISIEEEQNLYQQALAHLIPFGSPWQKALNTHDTIDVKQLNVLISECQKIHDEALTTMNNVMPTDVLYNTSIKMLSRFSCSLNAQLNNHALIYFKQAQRMTPQRNADAFSSENSYEGILNSFNHAAQNFLEALRNQRAIFGLLNKSTDENSHDKNLIKKDILAQLRYVYDSLQQSHKTIEEASSFAGQKKN